MPIACMPFRAVSSSLGGRSLLSAAALIPLHRVHWLDWLRSGHVWPRTKPAPYQSPSTGSFPARQQNMKERNWLMIASVLKSDIKEKLDLGDFKWLAVSLPVCRRSAMRAWLFRHQPQGRGPPPKLRGKRQNEDEDIHLHGMIDNEFYKKKREIWKWFECHSQTDSPSDLRCLCQQHRRYHIW